MIIFKITESDKNETLLCHGYKQEKDFQNDIVECLQECYTETKNIKSINKKTIHNMLIVKLLSANYKYGLVETKTYSI